MRKADRDGFLTKLITMRSRLSGEMRNLTDAALRLSNRDSHQPTHSAELGNDAIEQEVAIAVLESEGGVLGEINNAIKRFENNTFGTCERCAKRIPKPRLQVIPYTRFCVECQSLEERGR